jgi:hypothetical protein
MIYPHTPPISILATTNTNQTNNTHDPTPKLGNTNTHTHARILPEEETKRTTKLKKKMYKFTKMKLQQQPPARWLQQEALQSFVNSDKSYAVRSLDDGDHPLVVQQADHRA